MSCRQRLVAALTVAAAVAAGCATGGPERPPAARVEAVAPTPTTSTTPSPSASPARTSPSPTPGRTTAPPAPRPSVAPAAATRYTFPLRCGGVSYGHSHHDYPATDVFAPRGCPFVAPVDGRVDEVTTTDRWDPQTNGGATRGGLSVSVVGDDGVRYYGSHLQSVADGVRPGVRVRAGRVLGAVGDTGSARGTGTHLHFGLSWPTPPGRWWVRRGEVYPWPYLDSWRAGGDRSPAAAVRERHRQVGDASRCTSYC